MLSFSKLTFIYSLFCTCSSHRNRDFRLEQDLAQMHVKWIESEGACSEPKPQLFYLSSKSKVYYPRATVSLIIIFIIECNNSFKQNLQKHFKIQFKVFQ